MMSYPIYQVDAFTNKAFHGNPAAVIILQEWLSDDMMQKIAMENNLAETAFIVQHPAGHASGAHYHIRWFTPALEIDLCGHATVATACVLKKELGYAAEQVIFSTQQVGLLKVNFTDDGWYVLDFPARFPQATDAPAALLEALGIAEAADIRIGRDYFVVVDDDHVVRNMQPDFGKLKTLEQGIGVIVTAPGKEVDTVTRCFYPKAGIDEDPVTGSAHCNVVPYWAGKLGKTKLNCYQASPRGGELRCEYKGDRVLLAGEAVLVLKGEMFV